MVQNGLRMVKNGPKIWIFDTYQGDLLSTDQGGLNFTDIKNTNYVLSKSTFSTKNWNFKTKSEQYPDFKTVKFNVACGVKKRNKHCRDLAA